MHSKVEQTLIALLHRIKPDGQPIPHTLLQRLLSKTLTTLLPAPYQAIFMEWQYGTWMGAFAGHDEGGRQLGEANVQPEWLATPLPDHWRPFQGPGVRRGHPFNVDALRDVTQCWDQLLEDAIALRALYCRRHHREGLTLSAKDLYIIASVAVSIPAFMLRRGDAPVGDGAVPRLAAIGYKVIGGMYVATTRMLDQGHAMLGQDDLDVDVFLRYLEEERLLLSPESRACAAPVQMIQQLFNTLLNASADKPSHQALAYLGADVDRAFAYGSLCARIDLSVVLHWRILGYYLRPLLQNPDTSADVRDILLQSSDLGLQNDIPLQNYATAAKHILSVFESSEPEQALLALCTTPEAEDNSIEAISMNCYHLEKVMQILVCQQQPVLDQALQRAPTQPLADVWSPAPGSSFLKLLLKSDARLATSFNACNNTTSTDAAQPLV